jgi:transketolase N-terminal domain/subunit
MTFDAIDQMAVSTIRSLSIEAIQAANSGHPGLPMGAAPMAYVLWNHVMNVNLAVTGQTVTVLFFLQVMVLLCFIVYCTFLAMM